MVNNKLLIFDFDDTLVDTSDVYYRARKCFLQVLVKNGIEADIAVKTFEEVDSSNINIFGFSPDRYGRSMLGTYDLIAKKYKIKKSEEDIKIINSCGRIVLEKYPELINGACKLLRWASDNFTLALLTRGTYELQMKKINYVGISKYFRCINVVKEKNETTVRQLIESIEKKTTDTWMIGDSIKSDINPGIEAGAKCILYFYTHHSYRWEQEYTGEKPKGSFYKVEQLADVRQIIEAPEKFAQTTCILPEIR